MGSFLKKYAVIYLLVLSLFLGISVALSRAVTVVGESLPVERTHTIIIDAGHGGEDGGATSCTGVLESAVNLEIALRLDDLFHILGYNTVMIRRTDTAVYTQGDTIAAKKVSDLKNRVKTVNDTANALLISIHQNQFTESQYSGAQVFYSKAEKSKQLAEAMQSVFVTSVNLGSNRKCKKSAGVYLMEHIQCPGILVECGFLSNPEEEAKLCSPDYQKKLCCIIAATVSEFLSGMM